MKTFRDLISYVNKSLDNTILITAVLYAVISVSIANTVMWIVIYY